MSERGLEELEEKGQKSEVTNTDVIPLCDTGTHTLAVSGARVWSLCRLWVDPAEPRFLLRAVLFG